MLNCSFPSQKKKNNNNSGKALLCDFIMRNSITIQADQKGTKVFFKTNLLGLCARVSKLCSHKMPPKT